MAIKTPYFILLMFLVECFVFCQAAETDVPESSSYSIQETDEGAARFVQRIDWAPMEGILRYEVVLERRLENSGRYNEFLRETSEEPFLEISIPAGSYRYKVLGYNILNRLGAESNYQSFEVFQALQPLITGISPAGFFLDEDVPRRITLTGESFVTGGEIYLVPARRSGHSPDQEGVLIPSGIVYSGSGDRAELIFDGQEFPADSFKIVAVNPGGLTTVYEFFSVKKYRKPVNVNVSLGYAPIVPFYPFDLLYQFSPFANHLSNVLESSFYPLGFTLKASLVPFKTPYAFFGVELSSFYNYVNVTRKDNTAISTHIVGAALSALFQKPFLHNTLFLNMKIGGGFASYLDIQFEYEDNASSELLTTLFPEAQIGISGQYFVYKQAFVELGIDFSFFFVKDMFTVYINPAVSLGWQF